jgi:hypothetical protein
MVELYLHSFFYAVTILSNFAMGSLVTMATGLKGVLFRNRYGFSSLGLG